MTTEHRILFTPSRRSITLSSGATVLDGARKAGVGLIAVCDGLGTCHQCIIRLVQGDLNAPTAVERQVFSDSRFASGCRLACQAIPINDVTIDIPPDSIPTNQRLQVEGLDVDIQPDPVIDLASRGQPPYGLALDIGTTKLAAYLVNLADGRILAKRGAPNPQMVYGDDVISRIAHANRGASETAELHAVLIDGINDLVAGLCQSGDLDRHQILDAVVVGNTAMHHLFAGLPTRQLGEAPYEPAQRGPLNLPADSLGLDLAPGALVHLPPVIAGFVGSDHIAADLACSLLDPGENTLLVDIGTNTEITLRTPDGLSCCSCASGPAFEGAHIHAGMRAAAGAIERVFYDQNGWHLLTIDGADPIGICGSGILDAVAELRRADIIDDRGTLRKEVDRVERLPEGWAFRLADTVPGSRLNGIHVTRRDINEVQLAKAAIRTGIEVLMMVNKLTANQVKRVIVAGAFGTYLQVASAVAIGMFPDLPLERFQQVGNAAGAGARLILLSKSARQDALELQKRMRYVELTTIREFQEVYMAALPVTSHLAFPSR